MRAVNIFFVCLFLLSAGLQYNDPDPYVWMPIYLSGAYICYLGATDRHYHLLTVASILVYSSYAAYLAVDEDGVWSWWTEHEAESIVQGMKAGKPWIEETREFFGLLLLMLAASLNMFWFRKRKPARDESVERELA